MEFHTHNKQAHPVKKKKKHYFSVKNFTIAAVRLGEAFARKTGPRRRRRIKQTTNSALMEFARERSEIRNTLPPIVQMLC